MPLSRFQQSLAKSERLCLGLLSGTSADAAEAAVCRITGSGEEAGLSLLAHLSVPFDRSLADRILSADTAREISELNFLLGEHFARAALEVISQAKLEPGLIDVIGSHGQTVAHWPASLSEVPSTLQIGEATVIAERTGIPVVCDFRVRDMAVGGQGAPLVPYLDWALFRKPGVYRAFQNLGGIGNVSVVGARLADTVAFDTGPANMMLDGLARLISGGAVSFDRDGALARTGTPIASLLEELLRHPFLSQPPPRSAGRESFGQALVAGLWRRYSDRPRDLIATSLAFAVEATGRAYDEWIFPRFPLEGIYVSGGGTRNPMLMDALTARLSAVPVYLLDALGFPERAKEAACFALLASEFLSGTAQNVPSATGAKRSVVLGKMVP